MYNQVQQNYDSRQEGSKFSAAGAVPEVIAEPTLLSIAEELLKHIDALEREHSRMRGNLLGLGESPDPANVVVTTVAAMLSRACQRVASLVGDAATLNGRIG